MTLLNIMYIINNNNETHQNLCYDYHRFLKHKYNHKCQLVEGGGGLWGTLNLVSPKFLASPPIQNCMLGAHF